MAQTKKATESLIRTQQPFAVQQSCAALRSSAEPLSTKSFRAYVDEKPHHVQLSSHQ